MTPLQITFIVIAIIGIIILIVGIILKVKQKATATSTQKTTAIIMLILGPAMAAIGIIGYIYLFASNRNKMKMSYPQNFQAGMNYSQPAPIQNMASNSRNFQMTGMNRY